MEVYFDKDIGGYTEEKHAGKETRVDKEFEWADRKWLVPAVYSCEKGLVVSCIMRAKEESSEVNLSSPQYNLQIELNGIKLRHKSSSAAYYNGFTGGSVNPEANEIAEYYGLDKSYSYAVSLHSFLWEELAEIKTLFLTMTEEPREISGPSFFAENIGDTFSFVSPVSKTEYTLALLKTERCSIQDGDCENVIYPRFFTTSVFSVSPNTEEKLSISESEKGGRPVAVGNKGSAESIILLSNVNSESGERLLTACSSPSFKLAESKTKWQVNFFDRVFDKLTLRLI